MKKILILFLTLCFILPSAFVCAEATGLTFTSNASYVTEKALSELPVTYEAVLKLPTTQTKRAGVIAGSYSKSGTPCVNFEIYENGNPRLYYCEPGKSGVSCQFNAINV